MISSRAIGMLVAAALVATLLLGAAPRAAHAALICAACGKEITGNYVKDGDEAFHPACFTCARCGKPIEGPFVVTGKGAEHRRYHRECALADLPRCDICGKPIEGKYVEENGHRYHPDCYRDKKALHCSRCGRAIEGTYYPQGDRSYCVDCYRQYIAPHCVVCGEPIMDTDYPVNVWGEATHPKCAPALHECAVCGHALGPHGAGDARKLSDGREICDACRLAGITDPAEGRRLLEAAAAEIAAYGIEVDASDVTLDLCGQDRLRKISGRAHAAGHTEFLEETVNGTVVEQKVTIHILSCLGRDRFSAVAAHELTHVFLHRRGKKRLPSRVEEGFANYVASELLARRDGDLARHALRAMEEDPDPDYGEGYRHVRDWLKAHPADRFIAGLLQGEVPSAL